MSATVGKRVLYRPTEKDPRGRDVARYAAIVARVWNEEMVALSVLGPDGMWYPLTSAKLVAKDPEPGQCEPMKLTL